MPKLGSIPSIAIQIRQKCHWNHMQMAIDSYKIAVTAGQALNLLAEKEGFLDRFIKGEGNALQEWQDLQVAIHLNNMRVDMEKVISLHPVLGTQIDAKIKYQQELKKVK